MQTSILTVYLLISQTSPFIYHAHQHVYSSKQLEPLMHFLLYVLPFKMSLLWFLKQLALHTSGETL